MYSVKYTDKAIKSLKKIPKKWQERIHMAVESLAEMPYKGKKLQGEFRGLLSLRVWPYRIIYLVEEKIVTVVVLDIGHRQGIYR